MLKIPKGLKKKKKGKKSKRKGEEELFTEEELEQYKREHQSQPQQTTQSEADQEQSSEPKNNTENDEWSKFNALTTGVDSILKKTQGDLDRIKSTSFFQRVPAGPKSVDHSGKEVPFKRNAEKEDQRWVGFAGKKDSTEQQESSQTENLPSKDDFEPPKVESVIESESESEEEFDDIFDTSYVEAVEKGEVKLAYIPDSPEDEVDTGPDPFDTSYADKVIKGPEVSKKGKKLVDIGAAVHVLTGRIDHVTTSSAAIKRAKRRIPRDLLLDNPDNDDYSDALIEEAPVKSLLDDDTEDIVKDIPVDLSVSLYTQFISKNTEDDVTTNDITQNNPLNALDTYITEDDDDEFAQLAAESLNKPNVPEVVDNSLSIELTVEEESWAIFEETKSKPNRPPPPKPASGPIFNSTVNEESVSLNSPDEFECSGPDPFDTRFAENILPGKAELKQIEKEILTPNELPKSDSDFDFDPRADEKPYINNRRKSSVHIHVTDPTGIRESISGYDNGDVDEFESLKPIHRDLLGGSSTDLSKLADSPIVPLAINDNDQFDYSDPFDTSIVDLITAPGKTELKFIEKELLGESPIKRSLSDPDFDPRAEDKETSVTSPRKPSRPENLFVNKSVIFKIPTTEDHTLCDKNSKKTKPLTPYYSREASITDEEVDTQIEEFDETLNDIKISNDKPVTSILKNSLDSAEIKRSTSDQDLNVDEEFLKGKFSQLRRHSDFPLKFTKSENFANFSKPIQSKKTDFLSITEEDSVDTKVLTPFQEEKPSTESDIDPFDTSLVNQILLPGKTELKFLESELLTKNSDELNDPDFDPRFGENNKKSEPEDLLAPSDDSFQIKALTPEISNPKTGFIIDTDDNEIDPFDTSFANNLGPGKTELKLLESEFMN